MVRHLHVLLIPTNITVVFYDNHNTPNTTHAAPEKSLVFYNLFLHFICEIILTIASIKS